MELTPLLTRVLLGAAPDPDPYECRACGTSFERERGECSCCGSADVVRIDI